MKKINISNFFFAKFKVDLWSYFFYKENILTRHNQRYFVSLQYRLNQNSNFFFFKLFKQHNKNISLKYNAVGRLKNKILYSYSYLVKKNNKSLQNNINLKNFKIKKEEHASLKYTKKFKQILNSKFKNNSFFLQNKIKKIYKPNLLINKNLKKFNIYNSTTNLLLIKKRLGTASYDLFYSDYEGHRFKPRSFIKKKPKSKLKWHNWLNQKIISFYFGFKKPKKFFSLKKKLKNKKFLFKNSFNYLLNNSLLFFLFRLNIFNSFKHVYNLIKYGGIKVNGNYCSAPYKLIKKNCIIKFASFSLSLIFFNLLLLKIAKKHYLNNAVSTFYEIYFPLAIIKKIKLFNSKFFYKLDTISSIPKTLTWV